MSLPPDALKFIEDGIDRAGAEKVERATTVRVGVRAVSGRSGLRQESVSGAMTRWSRSMPVGGTDQAESQLMRRHAAERVDEPPPAAPRTSGGE